MCVNSSNKTRGMSGARTCMCELAFSQASLESSRIWFLWMGKELMCDICSVSFSCYMFMLVLTPTYKRCGFDTHLRNFRLPPRSAWEQRSSGLLHSEWDLLCTFE
jgi:hypothetical protein